jgi:hypothetical protein
MAQQFLHRADIAARLEQMCCKAVPKRVAARRLSDAGLLDCQLHGTLHGLFVQVVANRLARVHVLTQRVRRKQALPPPLSR